MTVSRTIGSLLLAAGIALSAQAALAQQQPSPGPMMGPGWMGPGMMGHGGYGGMGGGMMGPGMHAGMGPGMGPGMMMRYGPMAEGRLAYLKAELGITDTQATAWDDYAKALKSRLDSMQAMHKSMFEAMQSGTAMTRLDARIGGMETMIAGLKALRPATETLYNVLTEEQKKKADLLLGTGWGMM